jgi:hypothetical protein
MRSQFATFFPPSWCPTVPLFKNPETGMFLGFWVYGENANAQSKTRNKITNNQINKVCLLLCLLHHALAMCDGVNKMS